MRITRRILVAVIVVTLPFAFDLGFFAAGLLPPAKSAEEAPAADLIVVLTGGRGRLKEATQFLAAGKGKYLFVSGVEKNSSLEEILKANRIEEMDDRLSRRILTGDDSRSTSENAVEIRRAVESLRARSVLLVTSNYHMRRALSLLEAEFLKAPAYHVQIYTYPVESPNFEAGEWWRTFTGWQILLSEYVKSRAP